MFYEFIYLYLLHDSVQSTFKSYHEEPCHGNVIRNILSAIIVRDEIHTGRKLCLLKATEGSQEYPFCNNNKTDKLHLKHIQHVIFPEQVNKQGRINLLEDIVLPTPMPVSRKRGTFENVIMPSRLMNESEWSRCRRRLLGEVSQDVRNGKKKLQRYPNRIRGTLKSLQGNILKRRLMKQIKLKEWDKTFLNTEFRIDYILKELETHSPTHMLLALTMVEELGNIIVGNTLVNNSQVAASESILLTHKSIRKGQFSHLRILLFHLLSHTPYLESNVSIHKAKYLNEITVDNTWILLATKYLVPAVETQQNYVYANRDSSTKEGNEVGLHTELIQKANLENEVHVKDMFDGKQRADDPKHDSLTVRQSAVTTRKNSGGDNSLKSHYGLSKKKLSRKHRCLSSVEADTRETGSERSHSLSIIDPIPEEQLFEENNSLRTVGTITKKEISAKVNNTTQIQ
ncbi:hypothetical protein C922_05790, partial [Plasmodium inui San Antonio 1]